MAPRILVTHRVPRPVADLLSTVGEVWANPTDGSPLRWDLIDQARGARALLAFPPDRIDERLLSQCPELGIVAAAYSGLDGIDLAACTRRGIWVSTVKDLLAEPTAELAVALLLNLARRVQEGDRHVRSGAFRGWRPILTAKGLQGRTVGIVGLGGTGQSVAARLGPFGCSLIYADRWQRPPETEEALGLRRLPLDALLRESDYVVLCLPMNSDTLKLVGREALGMIRPGAGLVNVGRGSVVDEDAVVEALDSGRLGGYAADVFTCEDLWRSGRPGRVPTRLIDDPARTVLTPHLGSSVEDARLRIELESAGAIVDFLSGRIPRNAACRLDAAQSTSASSHFAQT
jgi:phosphonate dehydrogenase